MGELPKSIRSLLIVVAVVGVVALAAVCFVVAHRAGMFGDSGGGASGTGAAEAARGEGRSRDISAAPGDGTAATGGGVAAGDAGESGDARIGANVNMMPRPKSSYGTGAQRRRPPRRRDAPAEDAGSDASENQTVNRYTARPFPTALPLVDTVGRLKLSDKQSEQLAELNKTFAELQRRRMGPTDHMLNNAFHRLAEATRLNDVPKIDEARSALVEAFFERLDTRDELTEQYAARLAGFLVESQLDTVYQAVKRSKSNPEGIAVNAPLESPSGDKYGAMGLRFPGTRADTVLTHETKPGESQQFAMEVQEDGRIEMVFKP